ncbi:serine hydrolase domain-containing protein [Mycolicibacterium brisbanense]|uniref:Beta-lactamase n=1 Tax=Mycolicibacterium brisbanense TaxID=146020 RepID=A0A100VXB6_9MYCO|nr:serine hydrolase domain-containing protein [Mycolicibacterium brisbanense]MCV7159187.1 beta-lactamase family protein [Mycolicibacterium brisbanense]GAS87727.1 beta-lactamase [Mycolicibacterium brisbanense]
MTSNRPVTLSQLRDVVADVVAGDAGSAVPGIAVGISLRGDSTFLGYGVTSLEDPLPVTEHTIFQIGSISKTFVALLIARLVDAGRLTLDRPVTDVLDDVTVDPRITVRHLLTHSSGVSGDPMIANAPRLLAGNADDTLAVALCELSERPLDFAPGTTWSYSNAGIMLAAAIIERLEGRAYPDLLAERILHPLGMYHSFTTADEAITHRVAAPHADAWVLRDAGWQRHWQLPSWDVPGGGIVSTASDMVAYGDYLLSGKEPAILLSPQFNRGNPGQHFALAWYLDDIGGQRIAWHDGLTTGYCARMTMLLDQRLCMVVLTNSADGERLHRALDRAVVQAVTGVDPWPQPTRLPIDQADFEGDYDAGIYGTIRVTRAADDELQIEAHMRPLEDGQYRLAPLTAQRVVRISDNALMVVAPEAEAGGVIEYRRGPTGRVTHLRIADRLATKG